MSYSEFVDDHVGIIYHAWTIIANVSGGDWSQQSPEWQKAAAGWRDNSFHPTLKTHMEALDVKPQTSMIDFDGLAKEPRGFA